MVHMTHLAHEAGCIILSLSKKSFFFVFCFFIFLKDSVDSPGPVNLSLAII